MKTTKRFEELEIPQVVTEFKTEKEAEAKIKEMKKKLEKEFEKALNPSTHNISKEDLLKSIDKFFSNEYFEKKEHIKNDKLWDKLNIEWLEVSHQFFELQLELLQSECDDYDMEYTMQSELFQFFHENPDNRRARIEGPINRRIEKNERQTQLIEEKIQELVSYTIKTKTDLIYENLAEIGI